MSKYSIQNYSEFDGNVEERYCQDMHWVLTGILGKICVALDGGFDRTKTETLIDELYDLTSEIYKKGGWADNYEMTDTLYNLISSLRRFNDQRAQKNEHTIDELRKLLS